MRTVTKIQEILISNSRHHALGILKFSLLITPIYYLSFEIVRVANSNFKTCKENNKTAI